MDENTKKELLHAVNNHLEKSLHLSRELAEHPELPYKEYRSSKSICSLLEQEGFQVTYPYAGYDTGFCAVYENGPGPKVALLAEYDALPEIGHGCGHNFHGSLSLLTGIALKELKDHFQGSLYVIGTPAEEENGAKVGMADQGIFDDFSLAVMMHSWAGGLSLPNMDVLSLRCYVVDFHGESAHAVAAPWKGKSALAAARKFLDLIDARRECFTPDIHVNAVILDGGKAPNIIPDFSRIRIEFRTDSMAKLLELDQTVTKCAQAAAMALDCQVTFTPGLSDFADMVRVRPLEEKISQLFYEFQLPCGAVPPATGSSDMGNVSYRCPSIQPLLSITDQNLALHTKEFRDATLLPQAEKAMAQGACVLASLALEIFNNADFRDQVSRSWQESLSLKQNS